MSHDIASSDSRLLRIDLPEPVTARLLDHLSHQTTGDRLEDLLPRLLQSSAELPTDVIRTILTFRADPRAPSALLITGVPIDPDLPPTPREVSISQHKSGTISERSALLVAVLLGEPVAYLAEKDGVLVQDVFPTRAQRDASSNESSSTALGFHTELVFSPSHPTRPFHLAAPDFVLLLCLRGANDGSAATMFVDAKEICDQLSGRQIEILRQPQYQLVAPYSFTHALTGDRPLSEPVPLLRGPAESPSLAFDSACGIQTLTTAAEEALSSLVQACNLEALRHTVHLGEGDLLVLNNKRCAHARSAFPANFDGTDRWIQRVYVRREIWSFAAAQAHSYRVLA